MGFQAKHQSETFQIAERTKNIGYGVKEYDHSVQVRIPSFPYIPLVIAALDTECRCGFRGCGKSGAFVLGAGQRLAEKMRCPFVQVSSLQSNGANSFLPV